MKIACIGGGPAGLYFAISMKLRDASHEIEIFERNAPGVTFGWGVVFSDQTVENLQRNDPQSAGDHRGGVRALGRYRRPSPRRRRSPLAATASSASAASACSKSCRTRARELGVVASLRCRVRSRRSQVARLRPGHRLATAPTRASATPTQTRSASTSTCAPTSSCGSAHRKCSTLSPSRSKRPSTAGSGRTPIASRPTARPSSSNVRKRPGARFGFDRMSQDESIAACEKLFANYLDGHALAVQRVAPRRLGGMAQFPPHQVRALVERQCHPARRRRAHRAFLDRLGDQARARGRDQARGGAEPGGASASKPRSTNIRPSATSKC